MKSSFRFLGFLLFLCAANFVTARAQGIILPRPCEREVVRCAPPEWQQPLQLKSIHISTKITDQAAITHIEQVFENRSPHQLEGTYFFPLPDEVSISEFAMWDGNKRLVGEFRSREEARRIYDNIVRSRRDPALLEYAGKNLFQASVFPIAPHSEKKIELTYSQILRNDAGTVGYRYPLGTGWRANRFGNVIPPPRPVPMPRPMPMPRPQIETPIPPGSVEGGMLSAEIEIASRTPLKNIYSPSHDIEVRRTGEQKARITLERRLIGAQPDLQLFYSLSEQDFGVSLLTHREPGKDGYFMLLVSPKAELDKQQTTAKEIVFVVDTSGSMSDDNKIGKAKAALRFGVNALNARDRFNIVSFSGEEHLLAESLIAADNRGKQQALDFIEGLKATGGTNINDALLAALKQLRKSELPQMVVLLTDGQPTVGTTNANAIISNTATANKTNARVFTFGVGYDVNTVLLDALANEQRGTVAYVEPKEDLEIKVSSFFSKVNNPVLSDIQIDWGGMETELVYPRQMPDIFHGSQLVLVGRYRPQGKRVSLRSPLGTSSPTFLFAMPMLTAFAPTAKASATFDTRNIRLTLTGKANGQTRRFVYDGLSFPETARDNEFVPQLWAMRRVAHLLDQIKRNGEAKELREEIVELGTRYGIVTPYTSALVLEPGMSVEGDVRRVSSMPAPVSAPTGRRPERTYEKASPRAASETVNVVGGVAGGNGAAGQAAVSQSVNNATLRQADNLQANQKLADKEGAASGKINRIAGKTFYFANNVWSDSEYKPDAKLPEVKVKFASDEYYKLLKDEPRLADFLAQGTNVTVVWNGKVYLVTE